MIVAFDVTDHEATLSWSCRDGRRGREIVEEGRATEFLLPLIERTVDAVGEELSAVGVIVGPGSFTGIRVGLATAMGLSVSRGIPAHGFNKFELVTPDSDRFRLVMPAGRGGVVIATYEGGAPVLPPAIVDLATFESGTDDHALIPLPGKQMNILDRVLTDLAVERIAAGDTGRSLTPYYLRPPDAVAGRSLIDTLLERE